MRSSGAAIPSSSGVRVEDVGISVVTESLYDVAISFAGDDRSTARDLATQLLAGNYRVFYDEFQQADLWGEDLAQKLAAIYGEQSRYCVIIVSASYAAKVWTRLEFRAAVASALFAGDRDAYVLPLRLDDTQLPGLLPTIGYLDLRNLALEDVARLLFQKIGKPTDGSAAETPEVSGVDAVLSLCYRRAIFARFHAQLDHSAMLTSMSDCRVALQKQIVFVRPRKAQQLVAGVIAELDLVERVSRQTFTGEGLGTAGTIDGAKLRIIAALQTLADMSDTPLELPGSITEEIFWTQEDADAAPTGPETRAGGLYGDEGLDV
jgi:hypothetical protein